MKDQCIEHQKHEFPVLVMCRVLEVSESGFSAWRKRPICQRKREDAQRTKEIRRYLPLTRADREVRACTSNEMTRDSAAPSPRVARLMREVGMSAKRKWRRVVTTRGDASHPVAPHVLERDFTATEPNTKWVTDITSIPTTQDGSILQ